MRKLLICLSLLSLALPQSPAASAKDKVTVSVRPVQQDPDAADGGIIYALPQTVLQVKIMARAIVNTAGPFFKYSTRHLNLTDVVTANSVKWQIVGAEVSTIGRPDPSHRYKLTSSAAMPVVNLSPEGSILSFNSQIPAPSQSKSCGVVRDVTPTFADMSAVRLPGSVLTRTSTAGMAEECAQVIYSLREARIDLISGAKEAQLPDAGAFCAALRRIDDEEAALVSLFAGRRDTVYVSRIVEVVPDYNGSNSVVPIRFSETAGFVDALDLSGKPVYVDLEFDDAHKVAVYPDGSKQRKSAPRGELQYFMPSMVGVKVLDRNILLSETKVLCTQNAQIMTLPAALLLTHEIVFDSATGAISSLRPLNDKQEKTK